MPLSISADFDIEGHRGARALKPENTLPAFETALDLLVTTLELDLHYTADGVVVIWHDHEIGAEKCGLDPDATVEAPDPDSLIHQGDNLRISNLSYTQLSAFRCDRNPDRRQFPAQDNGPTPLAGDRYSLLSLEELFDFVAAYSQDSGKTEAQRQNAAQVDFNIETKRVPNNPEMINDGFDGVQAGPFELAILDLVTAHGLVDRVIIQSFDHRSLWSIRAINPDIRLSALTSGGSPMLAVYAQKGADLWSPYYQDITPALLAEAHEVGLLVIPWTVNDPEIMRALIQDGVDGLITDHPDILVGIIQSAGQ